MFPSVLKLPASLSGLDSDSRSWETSPSKVFRSRAAGRTAIPPRATTSSIGDCSVKLRTIRENIFSGHVFQNKSPFAGAFIAITFSSLDWMHLFWNQNIISYICTQLWSTGGEHTKDFVLIKSSFLKTAHESSLFQMQATCHTHSMQLIPKHTTLIRAKLCYTRSLSKWGSVLDLIQKYRNRSEDVSLAL